MAGQVAAGLRICGLCDACQHDRGPRRGWRWRLLATAARRDPASGRRFQERGEFNYEEGNKKGIRQQCPCVHGMHFKETRYSVQLYKLGKAMGFGLG